MMSFIRSGICSGNMVRCLMQTVYSQPRVCHWNESPWNHVNDLCISSQDCLLSVFSHCVQGNYVSIYRHYFGQQLAQHWHRLTRQDRWSSVYLPMWSANCQAAITLLYPTNRTICISQLVSVWPVPLMHFSISFNIKLPSNINMCHFPFRN